MIEWRNVYLSPEEIKRIWYEKYDGGYRVVVQTGSGQITGACGNESAAAEEARKLALQTEQRGARSLIQRGFDNVISRMERDHACLVLLDKRQRKLWRKLKEIIPEIGEEGAE